MKREGKIARRRLEFAIVRDQVARRKEAFIERLINLLKVEGQCVLYTGAVNKANGYGTINFRYKGKHHTIGVQRLFLILKTAAPVPKGYEAGHTRECTSALCVRHVELQHWKDNLKQRDGEKADSIPF